MILHAIFGCLVGVVLALTGAGGGILAVPLLVFGAQLSMAQAGPIGLMAVGLSSLLAALLGLRDGIVRYKAAALIALSGMLVSPLGLWLAQRLPNRPLALMFALVLLWVAYRSFQRAANPENAADEACPPCHINPATGRFVWTLATARIFVSVGMLTGLLSGLLGVGGGFVLVPVLHRYTDLPMKSIVSTALAVIALVSMAGVLASNLGGHFNWGVGLPFSCGAIGGMLVGRWLGQFAKGAHLNRAFGSVATLAALSLLYKAMA
jgi:uncharacterized membrane protein YfcA